jgi:hypothetical protein
MSLRLLALLAGASLLAGFTGAGDGPGEAQPTRSASSASAPRPDRPYLGQPIPGLTPERFAPGIISTDAIELNAVFSADFREFYFTRVVEGLDTMHQMTVMDGTWREARELMLFADNARVEAADMVLSADGQALYFLARYDRADTGPVANYDLWVSRRVNGDWGRAKLLGPPISTAADELYPVLGRDGSLYFNRKGIYRAQRRDDGGFDPPVTFGPSMVGLAAGDMALAPDESYLIMTAGRPGRSGTGDVHVSFRREDGSWGDLIRLDDTINTPDHEWCPMLTPDGRYLFFSRLRGPAGPPWAESTTGDVYWVDARILDPYRERRQR